MHTPRCFPPSPSLSTVLLPLPGEQTIVKGGVSTPIGSHPRSHALMVGSLGSAVLVEFQTAGEASLIVAVFIPMTQRLLVSRDADMVVIYSDTDCVVWREEVEGFDVKEGP